MQKTTPDQLAHFFALSLDLFCVADSDGYFRMLNDAWGRTLGYSLDELLAVPYINFVHPEDLNATVTVQQGLDDGLQVLDFENRYLTKDGNWRWLSWKAVPQADGTIYAVARDITSQKEDEKATEQLLIRLEQTNHELDQFAYIVSHDLKSPLRSILNLSQWIQEDLGEALTTEVAAHIALLQVRAGKMQQMIDDLLQYAKTGRNEKPVVEVDLNHLILEIQGVQQIPVGFRIEIPQPLLNVFGHPVELFQLFQNLISNAIKYRKSDMGFVSITQSDLGDYWRFEVADNGIGIDANHHQRIFEVFQRLHTSEEIDGTGIGLALVKKIIERMGGSIVVHSQKGSGATFSFTWPK